MSDLQAGAAQDAVADDNVKEVVPFYRVADMARSVRFYVGGLGFRMTNRWEPDGKLRWCWLTLGGASLMLQEFSRDARPGAETGATLGAGVSICFICDDAVAIFHAATARGLEASEPQVGNGLWETSLSDPDGYRVEFESPTDMPEETKLSEVA